MSSTNLEAQSSSLLKAESSASISRHGSEPRLMRFSEADFRSNEFSSEEDEEERDERLRKEALELKEVEELAESDLVQSADFVTALVGTSRKSSNSFRNAKHLLKIDSAILSDDQSKMRYGGEGMDELMTDEEMLMRARANRRKTRRQSQLNVDFGHLLATEFGKMSMMGANTIEAINEEQSLSGYTFSDINLGGVMKVIEKDYDDDEDREGDQLRESSTFNTRNFGLGKLKKTAITVMSTQKWRKTNLRMRRRRGKAEVNYQPTYRMEPKVSIPSVKHLIIGKVNQTMERLLDKHKMYDYEYTPKFLRILTELVKNDVKSFKLDRYKIVAFLTLVKKVNNQSMQYISRSLCNYDLDFEICLRNETRSYTVICLLYLIYYD